MTPNDPKMTSDQKFLNTPKEPPAKDLFTQVSSKSIVSCSRRSVLSVFEQWPQMTPRWPLTPNFWVPILFPPPDDHCVQVSRKSTETYSRRSISFLIVDGYTDRYTPTCPGIQSEDTIYTRAYSVFVPAFKARTNMCITHSKWGNFFTHLWTCLARTKRGLRPYPPTPIFWKSEDSAHSHKARTEILTSLCQNVLTLNVKKWFWSSLWMPGRTHRYTDRYTDTLVCHKLLHRLGAWAKTVLLDKG